MTTIDLLLAIGEADEDFVDEAGDADTEVRKSGAFQTGKKTTKRINAFFRWSGAAAMFILLIGAVWLYDDGGRFFRKDGDLREFCTAYQAEAVIEEKEVENTVQESMEAGNSGAEESMTVEGSGDMVADICRPMEEEEQQEQRIRTVMISSYDGTDDTGMEMAAKIGADMAVENGSISLSPSLRGAIECYGDREEYRYRVFVDLFLNGQQIANDGEEARREVQRLAGLGYIVAMETVSDGETTQTYFTLHATADQVKDFVADAGMGYALWLYDERVSANGNATGSANVFYGNSDMKDEGSFEGMHE